jgi:hypothetical protein
MPANGHANSPAGVTSLVPPGMWLEFARRNLR